MSGTTAQPMRGTTRRTTVKGTTRRTKRRRKRMAIPSRTATRSGTYPPFALYLKRIRPWGCSRRRICLFLAAFPLGFNCPCVRDVSSTSMPSCDGTSQNLQANAATREISARAKRSPSPAPTAPVERAPTAAGVPSLPSREPKCQWTCPRCNSPHPSRASCAPRRTRPTPPCGPSWAEASSPPSSCGQNGGPANAKSRSRKKRRRAPRITLSSRGRRGTRRGSRARPAARLALHAMLLTTRRAWSSRSLSTSLRPRRGSTPRGAPSLVRSRSDRAHPSPSSSSPTRRQHPPVPTHHHRRPVKTHTPPLGLPSLGS
mmetsp:Transcript_22021/g.24481  ORF Transcript_22021/g.24481 Transcript_22021/m.24481 type:complete len:315 (+) Transcript_22021:385-1329(+)